MNCMFRVFRKGCFLLLMMIIGLQMGACAPREVETNNNMRIEHLLTNGVTNPEVVDAEGVLFSWQIHSETRGTMQSAYQIIVSEALSGTVIWNSEKVTDIRSASVLYEGPDLTSDTSYIWQVRIWDQDDTVTDYSEPAEFRVGLDKNDWTASYIWDDTENENDFVYFRKSFEVADKEIVEAVVYTSAHNDYQLYLNGCFVGAGPARSNPVTYGQYCAYDITDWLKSGGNTFAAIAHWHGVWLDSGVNAKPAYILEARIRYADGTQQTIVTDESWKTLADTAYIETNPVYFGHYGGAKNRASIRFDARKEPADWKETSFIDDSWTSATIVDRPEYDFRAQMVGEQTEMERITPTKVYQEGNVWFAEFDTCLTGWPELRITDNAEGDRIKLQYWEVQRGWGDAGFDTYICTGGTEVFDAPFVRHTSFKIIEITGYKGELSPDDITGIVAYSATEKTGSFECSDERLNAVYEMCERSGRQTVQQGIISVDANREQSPWTADCWQIGLGSLYNHQDTMLIDKIIRDYAGEQMDSGNFLTCSPAIQYRSELAEWSMYWPMLLWQEYLFKGNEQLLQYTYSNLTRFMDYITQFENMSSGLYNPPGWRASDYAGGVLQSGGENIATNCQLYMNFEIAAEIARLTGHNEDIIVYTSRADKLKNAINANLLIDGERYATTPGNSQTVALGTAWAIGSDVVPDAFRERVIEWLAGQCNDYNVGGHGGDALYTGLYEAGLGHIATTDYARYDQMLKTNNTNWESFGELSIDNMGNHAWTAYPAYLLPRYVGGIQPTSGGFADVLIQPVIGGLSWAKVTTPTIKGTISVDWERVSDTEFTMQVTVPANVRASIRVPDNDMTDLLLTESGSVVYEENGFVSGVEGITNATRKDGYVVVTAGGGSYHFVIKGMPKETKLSGDEAGIETETFSPQQQLLLYVYEMSRVDIRFCMNSTRVQEFKAALEQAWMISDDEKLTIVQAQNAILKVQDAYDAMNQWSRPENLALHGKVEVTASMNVPGYWMPEYLTDGFLAKDNSRLVGYTTDVFSKQDLDTPLFITIDMGEIKLLNTIVLYPRLGSASWKGKTANFMSEYELQLSIDGKNFDTVYAVEVQTDPDFSPVNVEFQEKDARYIRLVVTKLGEYAGDESIPNAYRLQLSEIEAYLIQD